MHLFQFIVYINLFFSSHSVKILYESQSSSCYSNGKALQCQPSFTNIIENVQVETTSTCGLNGPEQICRNWYDRSTNQARQYCNICDVQHNSYPNAYLTDRHIPNNQTCWFSGPLQEQIGQNEVNITISLKKSFEVYYIALQICGTLPDSIAIYKSLDFGLSWKPWQFFSQDCYRAFKMPTANENNLQITPANIQEVLCVELKPPDRYNDLGQAETVIPFSTTIGRPSTHPWSQGLIEWMTMTNLKITLMRFSPVKTNSDRLKELFYHSETLLHGSVNLNYVKSEPIVHFGLSDIAVGGRCKCNGHASRCLQTDNNDIRCDCQHNTEGQDCERCKANYLDLPWDRATRQNAHVCKMCQCFNHTEKCMFSMSMYKQTRGQHGGVCLECRHNTAGYGCNECAAFHYRDITKPITHAQACKDCECNSHSDRCQFSKLQYLASNYSSGGICIDCQHHTTGRNCERCLFGYYRDWSKPFRHRTACTRCNCHSIGSIKPNECDKNTGQCQCKEGVTGQTCDRCKEGYKQTSSSIRPCIPSRSRNLELRDSYSSAGTSMDDMANISPICKKCNERRKRIRFKKFCTRKAVFRATVQSKKTYGNLLRYELKIRYIWRVDKSAWEFLPKESPVHNTYAAWINAEDVRCNCPRIILGQSYLFLTRAKFYIYKQNKELLIDNRSVILPWQNMWQMRLTKFQEKEKRGKCDRFFTKKMKNKFNDLSTQSMLKMSKHRGKIEKSHHNKYGPNYGYYGTQK